MTSFTLLSQFAFFRIHKTHISKGAIELNGIHLFKCNIAKKKKKPLQEDILHLKPSLKRA